MRYYEGGLPMPDSYTVRLVDDMPIRQGGMIAESPDGHINVYINARLSSTGQHTAAFHEWEHWYNDDLNNDRSIQEVEGAPARTDDAQMPPMKRARDLIPKEKQPVRTSLAGFTDWGSDIIHRLPYYD